MLEFLDLIFNIGFYIFSRYLSFVLSTTESRANIEYFFSSSVQICDFHNTAQCFLLLNTQFFDMFAGHCPWSCSNIYHVLDGCAHTSVRSMLSCYWMHVMSCESLHSLSSHYTCQQLQHRDVLHILKRSLTCHLAMCITPKQNTTTIIYLYPILWNVVVCFWSCKYLIS